jgi:RNA polymerase sigma factor (sigma-70 family)
MTRMSQSDGPSSAKPPDARDQELLERLAAGEQAALSELMNQYDRLVRYTIYRAARDACMRDPEWLDGVASETWTGFVRSLERRGPVAVKDTRLYLIQTARNRAISTLRGKTLKFETAGRDDEGPARGLVDEAAVDPAEEAERLDTLEALRSCLAALDPEDQRVCAQDDLISSRRWREAAESLGMSESTLRSRWKKISEKLRRCVDRKTGKEFAREAESGDSLGESGAERPAERVSPAGEIDRR